MARPLFLSLDGIDGTGKSTQCRLLADWLRELGRTVVTCNDPGSTPLGERLREIVLDHREEMSLRAEALMYGTSRAELVERIIRPALAAGKDVISDRFVLANVVYQGHAGGLDPEELWQVGRFSSGGLMPDLTIVLDLPIELARARMPGQADRIERRPAEYHERVRQGFLREARQHPGRMDVVDASPPVEVVQEQIRDRARKLLTS